MRKLIPALLGSVFSLGLVLAAPVSQSLAQTNQSGASQAGDNSYNPDHVVARVNGEEIILENVVTAWQSLPGDMRQKVSFQQMAGQLLNRLIDEKLASAAAMTSGLETSEAFLADLESAKRRLLLKFWLQESLNAAITEDIMQQAYQQAVANMPEEEQRKTSHILVKTEQEALNAIAELNNGAEFSAVAKRVSTGPSGPQGGELGWIKKTDVVEAFGTAAFNLRDGEISVPVKTRFGWHVIKGGGSRMAPKPTIEQIAPQLRRQVEQNMTQKLLDDLRKNAKLELFDMQGNPVDPQQAQ